jgi:hypothetical protein
VLLPENRMRVLEVAAPWLDDERVDPAVRARLLEAKGASA